MVFNGKVTGHYVEWFCFGSFPEVLPGANFRVEGVSGAGGVIPHLPVSQ